MGALSASFLVRKGEVFREARGGAGDACVGRVVSVQGKGVMSVKGVL